MPDDVGSVPSVESETEGEIRGTAVSALQASGLPFQLAVEHRINELNREASAYVVGREVPWRIGDRGPSGWADIVVDCNSSIYCVLECKRYRERNLVFLRTTEAKGVPWLPVLMFERASREKTERGHPGHSGYVHVEHRPSAGSAYSFCVFKDSEDRILERLASDVSLSTEALMLHELADASDGERIPRITRGYLAVLVVNLPLFTCSLDPSLVPLRLGKLPVEAASEIREVPFVRFQKPLGGLDDIGLFGKGMAWPFSQPPERRPSHLSSHVRKRERCVWIVALPRFCGH